MQIRTLVIEDNENNIELISFILEHSGYIVIVAKNGFEGLSLAQSELPDLIILDVQLPDIDGFEVLRKIRSNKELKSIPVIVMSSYALSGDKGRMKELGANCYIEKPINPERIIKDIKSTLDDRNLHKQVV